MPRITRSTKMVVGSKELIVGDLLKTLIYLPGEQINQYFEKLGLRIPRDLRIYVLREIMREKVAATRKSRLTLADELNYRLSWFAEFSETQLENLLVFFEDVELFKFYLEDLWIEILGYMVEKKVTPLDLKHLHDQSLAHVRAVGLELPNYKTFNRDIKHIFFDEPGKIDGLSLDRIRPVLYKSSTLGEVRDFGMKYDVDVPRRLKKNELADIIVQELKERKMHTDQLEKEIRKMSVIMMQRYAKDYDIKASTELKKEEIIEYVLSNANETKETYYIPESPEVYEKEIDHLEEKEIEAKEKVEEVQRTPYTQARPEVQYVSQNVDLSGLIREMRLLRESVEKLVEAMKPVSVQEVEKSEKKIETFDEKEALIINAAEFYGSSKSLKKAIKEESLEEKKMMEEETSQKKAKKEDKEKPKKKEKVKKEKVKKEAKARTKTQKIIALVFLGLALVVLFVLLYGIITYFAPEFLAGFGRWLDRYIKIDGSTGFLEYYHNLIRGLGI